MNNLRYRFLPSFDRSIKRLEHQRKHNVSKAAVDLIKALSSGLKPEGLGVKKLSADIWEARAGIKDRILFLYTDDLITFLIAGNHDEISKFIKRNA